MKLFKSILLLILVIHGALILAQQAEKNAAATTLHAYLLTLDSYEANFQQQVVSNSRRLMESSSGKFIMQRPNQFRWQIMTPYEQIIIADGKALWSIDKDLEQVTVADLDSNLVNSPIRLLTQENIKLDEFFNVQLQAAEDEDDIKMQRFLLRPIDNSSNFESVQLGFNDGVLQLIELHDSLGQITVVTMTNIRNNPIVDISAFVYKVIPEYDFIDSRTQDSKGD